MLLGLLHMRCACAVLAVLSYRLLFHSDRALSLGALLLALVCAASAGALLGDAGALLAPAAPWCAADTADTARDTPDAAVPERAADLAADLAAALEWARRAVAH